MTAQGFGSIKPRPRKKGEKVREDVCQQISKEISKKLHPNGEPENMRTASWIDYETGDWMFADITNRPELWHLAGFNVESKKRWDAKKSRGEN